MGQRGATYGEWKVEKAKFMVSTPKMKLWLFKGITTFLFWICVLHFVSVAELWSPKLLKTCPSSFNYSFIYVQSKVLPPPKRIYKNNGYLIVSCNGGLNQMRDAICDMVAIARYLNVTLIVPELDKTSFWADPSDFKDIFDVITSLRVEVRILKKLPPRLDERVEHGILYELSPISWSNISYYDEQILPLLHKYKVVRLNRTDARLANNGLPLEVQKLRCRVNFDGLRVGRLLRRNGPFLVLHLRYEMDMLAFSGCNRDCHSEEVEELTRTRYANPLWKEKEINSDLKRIEGQYPLTPEETAIVLKALDIDSNIQIYGDIWWKKENEKFITSISKIALDYLISLEGDIFVPTYDGNMARVVEGHRRYLGFKKSISLDRKASVSLIDQYSGGLLNWDDFSNDVKRAHSERMGGPRKRIQIRNKPKEEEFLYANPEECLQTQDELITNVESMSM